VADSRDVVSLFFMPNFFVVSQRDQGGTFKRSLWVLSVTNLRVFLGFALSGFARLRYRWVAAVVSRRTF
jgi:hypothetical protein